MKTKPETIKAFSLLTASRLGGVGRAAMMLAVMLLTTLTAEAANTEPPYYNIDYVKGGTGYVFIKGWAVDKNYRDRPVGPLFRFYSDAACNNQVWIDGAEPVYRPDVNEQYNTTGDHGFEAAISVIRFADFQFPEGATEHTFYVRIYVNNTSQESFEVEGSPFPVTVKKIWGFGTEEDPFLISNAVDWNSLADDMADDIIGDFYTDKFYELANEDWCQFDNSTPVTKMWGFRPFTGHFNGNGKTLNVSLSGDAITAPFITTNGATIENLTVSGTINTVNVAGGIVGYDIGGGTLSLRNCVCSAAISGFGNYAGGLVGTCGDLTLNLKNCLFKGSFTPRDNGKYQPIACKNATATVKANNIVNLFYMNTTTPSEGLGDNVIIGAEGVPVYTDCVPDVWDEPVTAADGQTYYAAHFTGKRLPYSYGFDNNDLEAEGWTLLKGEEAAHAGISTGAGGISNFFSFGNYVGETDKYLISPELYPYSAIIMTFVYSKYRENTTAFQVGYSTTTKDPTAFIWDSEIIVSNIVQGIQYERSLPQGTRYVAIKCPYALCLDDFNFTACTTPSPASISVSKLTDQSGTLTWEEPDVNNTITGYSYQYKKKSEESWSDESFSTASSADLSGLSPVTDYDFRVRTHYGEDTSIWLYTTFTTAVALPYVYGFENGTNGFEMVDGWKMENCDLYVNQHESIDFIDYTGIRTYAHRDGEKGFCFSDSESYSPQYLVSPCLPCNVPIVVSFYYKDKMPESGRTETFKVGYSTTTSDISAFTWDDEISAETVDWTKYEKVFPVGTQYIAVAYTSTLRGLYLDDFSFERYSSKPKPTNLTVSNLTSQSATLTWTAPDGATLYAYQYKKADETDWSAEATSTATTVTLSNLTANTAYDIRVKALFSGNEASNDESMRFMTEGPVVGSESLPYTEGFENGMGGWRIMDGHVVTGIYSKNTEHVHSGNSSFQFYIKYPVGGGQYLISPQFDGQTPMKVSFYYKGYKGSQVYFQVGYSTTTKNSISDFRWQPGVKVSDDVWHEYADYCPEGTKYFAIRWYSGDYLYLDDITFKSTINIAAPEQITASGITATKMDVSWTGNAENFELQYREKALFADDFESGMGQWKNVHNYYPSDWRVLELTRANDINHVTQSTNILLGYDNNNNVVQVGTLDVDEWLVSPKVKLTGTLGFMAHFYSQSFEEGYDKCEVLVSTTTDNVPGAFTSIGTIDASTSNSFFEQEQYFLSLDSYNGQEGYIAFRHKSRNSSWLIVDDVSIYRTAEDWTSVSTAEKSVRLTELQPHTDYEFQVRVLQDNYISKWSSLATFTTEDFVSLSENSNNAQTIYALADGHKHDVILQGRTFYRHRYEWNTLCLPFSLSDFSGTPLEGATVKALSGSDFTDGTLTLSFTEVSPSGEHGGLIEAGRPYVVTWANGADLLINSSEEWTAFSERVNSGETFAGKNVMLGADISVNTMAGTADHPFCGIFDGNGHTIDLYINQPDAEYAAPLRYINGATICNVKVTGSVKGGNYCAGLVGAALGGTNSIRNCWMAATVTTSGSQIGGILGHGTTSATTVSNCYMNGNLDATNIGVFYGGGSEGGTHTLTKCWATGTYNRGMEGSINLLLADGGTVSVTNCRHNNDAITQGTYGLLITSDHSAYRDFLGSQWTVDGNGRLTLRPSSERAATDIKNPVFYDVTLSSNAPTAATFAEGQFLGTFSPLADASDWLPDAHNTGNGAFHALLGSNQSALGSDFVGWYSDAAMTTPATTIPFDVDGKVTLYAGWEVKLADASDNSGTISEIVGSGKPNNKVVVLDGRTFYHDSDWNTLCLPFSVSSFSGTPLEGATVMTLGSSDFSGGTLMLSFTEATSIDAGRPYFVKWQDGINLTINSDDDWTAFAQRVNNGETFAGKNVLLGADVNVTSMVGTEEHPFCGTFDGAGHTLNVSIDQEGADYAAPFRYINGATIRSVKVTGSVKGGDYCAGLVGAALGGTNSIHDCWMNATVTTYSSYIGGILGHGTTSATTVACCYVDGDLKASHIGIIYCGGSAGGTHAIERCWVFGSYFAYATDTDLILAPDGMVTNCRKTTDNNLITQGVIVNFTISELVHFLGSQWMVVGNGTAAALKQTTTLLDKEIRNPVFSGATISDASAPVETNYVDFIGITSPVDLAAKDYGKLYLGAENTLYYPSTAMTINACRAYFQLKGITVGDIAATRLYFINEEATGIILIGDHTTDVLQVDADAWFTLDGLKLQGKPTKHGLYIHNGRKVVIK